MPRVRNFKNGSNKDLLEETDDLLEDVEEINKRDLGEVKKAFLVKRKLMLKSLTVFSDVAK